MERSRMSHPDMFQSHHPLECGFCRNRYENEADLLLHQQNRGHWLNVFDRRARPIRRPSRFEDNTSSSSSSTSALLRELDTSIDMGDVIIPTEITEEANEEEEENDQNENSEEFPTTAENDSPSAAAPSESVQIHAPTELTNLSIQTLCDMFTPAQRRTLQIPSLKSNCWKNVIARRCEGMDVSSAASILRTATQLECIVCTGRMKIFTRPSTEGSSIFELGSNINKHLDNMHAINPKRTKKRNRQETIHQSQVLPRLLPGTQDLNLFWRFWALSMLSGNIADSFTENPLLRLTFKTFLNASLPNRRQLADIHEQNDAILTKYLEEKLQFVESCALSTDSWSSVKMQMYSGVMIHFIDHDFRLCCWCLAVVRFSKEGGIPASAENLAQQMRTTLLGMPACAGGKTVLEITKHITTDAAPVMPAMVSRLHKVSKLCLSHQLQLVVKEFCVNQDHWCILIGLASKITASAHRSTKISDSLRKRIQKSVPTRFDSYLIMVRSVLEVLDDLHLILEQPGFPPELHTAVIEFQSLRELANSLVVLLEPFAVVTAFLGAQKIPTIHQVIPFIIGLEMAYANFLRHPNLETATQAAHLRQLLNARFAPLLRDPDYMIAAVLCPITRKRLESPDSVGLSLIQQGKTLLLHRMQALETELISSGLLQTLPSAQNQETRPWIDQLLPLPSMIHQSRAEQELHHFYSLPLTQTMNILDFWRQLSSSLPILSRIAREILCMPASSLAVERTFSKAGRIVTAARNQLSPHRINILCRSKHNIEILRNAGDLESIFFSASQNS